MKTATFALRKCNDFVAGNVYVAYIKIMTSGQFKRWLAKQGCNFESGKGGHLIVGKGLENRIKKDLGLK